MGKRGPKPSSPNGEPKKRVTLALASDVIEFMYRHKPTVPWLESVMRDLRAGESHDSGDALATRATYLRATCGMDGCLNYLPDDFYVMNGRKFCSYECAIAACALAHREPVIPRYSNEQRLLRDEAISKMRDACLSGVERLLREWTMLRHENHVASIAHVITEGTPDVDSYRCAECRETLTFTRETRMDGNMLKFTITPSVSFE